MASYFKPNAPSLSPVHIPKALEARTFLCISATSFLPYAKDEGTGRCRLSTSLMVELDIGIGTCLELAFSPEAGDSKRGRILCVAYPDTSSALSHDQICYDDSVHVPLSAKSDQSKLAISSPLEALLERAWEQSGSAAEWIPCVVTAKYAANTCRKVYIYKNEESDNAVLQPNASAFFPDRTAASAIVPIVNTLPAVLGGLAVRAGCVIKASSAACRNRCISIQAVLAVNAGQAVAVVDHGSMLLYRTKHAINEAEHDLLSPNPVTLSNAACSTQAVQQLLRTAILPCVTAIPPSASVRGVLLLGPPGVGKSFSVRAVQQLCTGMVDITIREISLPQVLAHDDSAGYLEGVLNGLLDGAQETASSSQQPSAVATATDGHLSKVGSVCESGGNATIEYKSPSKTLAHGSPSGSISSLSVNASFTHSQSSASGFSFRSPSSASGAASCPAYSPAVGTPISPGDAGQARTAAAVTRPRLTLVLLDEIDALGGPGKQSDMQRAAMHVLCRWLDALQIGRAPCAANYKGGVCLVATSNRATDVHPMLQRGGRLERTVHVTTGPEDRRVMLQGLLQCVVEQPAAAKDVLEESASKIANSTGGYSAADLVALVGHMRKLCLRSPSSDDVILRKRTGQVAYEVDVMREQVLESIMKSFARAHRMVTPSCLRGVSVDLPRMSYDDIIGLDATKAALQRVLRFAGPAMREKAALFGISSTGGVLLFGPPGNSKTRLVMAAASAHGLPVISLSAADVYSPYVGDAEAEVRRAFGVARQASPCVLFLDEIDALVTNRDSGGGGASVESRVLATLLTEMDGVGGSDSGVIVLAATNRVESIDAALLRKGRFHHLLEVPAPDESTQRSLLRYFAARSQLPQENIAELLTLLRTGMSGADVENLCREEAMRLLRARLAVDTSQQ